MNIYLIGYRCTGKTTIGKALAEKLEWDFIDADEELVRENRITISEMVAKNGWDFFREKECEVIQRLSKSDQYVIGTGGGVILNKENIQNMEKNGVIVWLKASPEVIKKRILEDENTCALRPALTSKGLLEEIEETLLNRTPLYESAADFSVDTDCWDVDEICRMIITRVRI